MSSEQRFTDSLGVSAIVRILRPGSIAEGDIGMVFEQRPAGAHRYGVLVPGCPLPIWYRAEDLEVLQGIDTEGWWHRG